MAMREVLPLRTYGAYTETTVGTGTSDVFQIPPGVSKAIAYLYVSAVPTGGTTPTLDARIQGASRNVEAWFTALPTWKTGTAPNSVHGIMAFTQTLTVGSALQAKYTEFLPPYVRLIDAIGGSSRGYTYGVDLVLQD